MKIVFFGTPEFVIPILECLHDTYNRGKERQFIAVVTQPPKIMGREKRITRSAVDNWAYKHKVDVITDPGYVPQADLGIVAAYGQMIPKFVIQKFKFGILNIHPSLLPKYRGASPIQGALVNGDTITGVTVIKMDEKMDHGPIISQFKDEILPNDTNETLRKRLFERSAQFLIDLLPNYLNGKIKPKEQDHDNATFTKLVTKEDGFIKDPFEDPQKVLLLIRAYTPWPGVWTYVYLKDQRLRLRIYSAHIENGKLVLDEVQLEGKTKVSWEQFTQGYPDYSFK
jgi:methionyl-tRNA formyltransferase